MFKSKRLYCLSFAALLLAGCGKEEVDPHQAHLDAICKDEQCKDFKLSPEICTMTRGEAIAYEKTYQYENGDYKENYNPQAYSDLLTTHLSCLKRALDDTPLFNSTIRGNITNEISFAENKYKENQTYLWKKCPTGECK